MSRLTLRVVAATGARGNSPCFQRSSDQPEAGKQSARFIPPTPPMLGAGQRDIQNLNATILLLPILRPPEAPNYGGGLKRPPKRSSYLAKSVCIIVTEKTKEPPPHR